VGGGAASPEQLEASLRSAYRAVNVSVAINDGHEQRWYVYRDGRWVNALTGMARNDRTRVIEGPSSTESPYDPEHGKVTAGLRERDRLPVGSGLYATRPPGPSQTAR
jgi:hypothetical protein